MLRPGANLSDGAAKTIHFSWTPRVGPDPAFPPWWFTMKFSCSLAHSLVMMVSLFVGVRAPGQTGRATGPDVGVRFNPPDVVALTNARIIVQSGREIENGSLIIEGGRIQAVGSDLRPPAGAEIIDCAGDYLYPGLIDALVECEASESKDNDTHWHAETLPQRRMSQCIQIDASQFQLLRKAGIAVVLAAPRGGIIKGQSCVLTTAAGSLATNLLREDTFQHVRLYPARGARESYPNSPMGAMALVRQTLSDAKWYQDAKQVTRAQPELPAADFNSALHALGPLVCGSQAAIIDGTNELYALRADRIAREFSLQLVIRGSGREYRRLDALAATGRTFIIPVDYPDAPEVATQQQMADASLQDLMDWHLAPSNLARLEEAGVPFVITADGLGKATDLIANIRKAIEHGLDPDTALEAVTSRPAKLLGIEDLAGSLERGKFAHLLRTDGPLFDQDTRLKETWVQGQRHQWVVDKENQLQGEWRIELAGERLPQAVLQMGGTADKPTARIGLEDAFEIEKKKDTDQDSDAKEPADEAGDEERNGEPSAEDAKEGEDSSSPNRIADLAQLKLTDYGFTGTLSAGDLVDDVTGTAVLSMTRLKVDEDWRFDGILIWPDGVTSRVQGSRRHMDADKSVGNESDSRPGDGPSKAELSDDFSLEINYPLGVYGIARAPEQPEWVLFRNATLWTCSDEGILPDTDLLVHRGKIEVVGKQLEAPEKAIVIEAEGMHISPGIIDCHSHMATDGGVNESGQAVTAEVRIGDFIDPNDINIYRQLAGGVTTSNILHGSANPIGGQNQVIKLRWGSSDEDLKMTQAPAGIKFALGENVKQSNRENEIRTRYPQTRMGVEQILRDRFEAARLYQRQWKEWRNAPRGLPPRKDFELEAIAEILEGQRWIHCHSYRQDEILATLRVLEDYGVTVGSLQHILEGYKVADAMAAHGAMASSFSDWWAYKFEVYDAIPYNGALMHRAGIVVSFNSDDRELARHLNHEAAKAVKYGGLPESEALQFVTLNPAKQLRIDPWVGSLERGKDADLVLWNRSPLSTLSVCMQTWIDGRKYFDRQIDLQRRQEDEVLRMKLMQRVLESGVKTSKRGDDDPSYWWVRHDEFCHHGEEEHEGEMDR